MEQENVTPDQRIDEIFVSGKATILKIWELRAIMKTDGGGPWQNITEKHVTCMVVVAASAESARDLAGGRAGDEGRSAWLIKNMSLCLPLGTGNGRHTRPTIIATEYWRPQVAPSVIG